MDTSETYIKMVEKATEIQVNHRLCEDGDYLLDNDEVICWCECCLTDDNEPLALTWLPRQDQLQEMVNLHNGNYNLGLQELHQFVEINLKDESTWVFASWEQVWLAFVMNEKYNKIWNSEEWIDG